MGRFHVKDPSAVLDYRFDWSAWLTENEVIATSTMTVAAGITKDSEANSTTTATVWLSGGAVGTEYLVVNRIVTDEGRADERSIVIHVEDR